VLRIVVNDLASNDGHLLVELSDADDQHIKGYSGDISGNACTIIVDSLKAGQYAFRYFHDENDDEELNTYWTGIPKEGCGFSNNAFGKFGPPKFEKTVFELRRDTTMFCTPWYFKR
jgi:uncharacterized protein (DUF2141 family)